MAVVLLVSALPELLTATEQLPASRPRPSRRATQNTLLPSHWLRPVGAGPGDGSEAQPQTNMQVFWSCRVCY